MNKQFRTTTPAEKLIFTWMKHHVTDISITKISSKFGITRDESERMITWFNLNPDSDYKEIRTI